MFVRECRLDNGRECLTRDMKDFLEKGKDKFESNLFIHFKYKWYCKKVKFKVTKINTMFHWGLNS